MNMIAMVKGFKSTDANMQCRGYQFELGKEYTHEGEIEMCSRGFHFCIHPSGVWSFYNNTGTRVFEVEAYDVLDEKNGHGAEVKMVARKIKFVRELKIGGYRNTGNFNTGNFNSGNFNSGNLNSGNLNSGNFNSGNFNSGNNNSGSYNSGNFNSGSYNSGDCNSGDYNATNYSSGFFCQKEQSVLSFDVVAKLNREEYFDKYGQLVRELGNALQKPHKIPFEKYKTMPGITAKKLKSLHAKFIKHRMGIEVSK